LIVTVPDGLVDSRGAHDYVRRMRAHHTKNKGDLGLLRAQLDLAEKGFGILVPLTEHEAFDLVAYKGGAFYRIQVKYRAAVRGVISVPFSTSWADRHGVHCAPIDKANVDYVCLYCPDTTHCYYVDPKLFGGRVTLRITPTRNNQAKGVLWADDFRELRARGDSNARRLA